MHKITNLWKFELNTPLLILMHDVIILTQNEAMGARPPSLAVAAPIASFCWGLEIKFMENYFFLENYVTSEGAVYHNVLLSTSPHYSLPSKVLC